ncbi:ran guanine nucleotide release factor isoform X2 [Xenopus tropicalis]|uniref:Ran guanine nucleotide release factor isoform X2 n=1 Tax=Xenopus tropicalis TaxID=8364 RepID=A0A8J0T017_XENTR|nr:ran guanine nucleotide release factor isoform X2 [Xenopus tropicalis]
MAVFAGKFFPTQPGRISSDVIIVRPEPALRAEVEGKHAEDRNASSADSPMAQDSQPHPLFAGAFSAVLPPFSQDVRYHFEDVASSNDAEGQSEVLSVEPLPLAQLTLTACTNAWVLTGHQLVAKFNEEARNAVTIHMALFRLPQHSTDMLVTFNDPAAINPSSSSAVGGASLAPLSPWTLADFNRLLCTLQLHNPSIFG